MPITSERLLRTEAFHVAQGQRLALKSARTV
jgi:hypothetical protein